jgi:hypothetical protein
MPETIGGDPNIGPNGTVCICNCTCGCGCGCYPEENSQTTYANTMATDRWSRSYVDDWSNLLVCWPLGGPVP